MTLRFPSFDFRNLAFRNPEVDNPLPASNALSAYAKCAQLKDHQEGNAGECTPLPAGG
jgi:hypothetical protein